MQLLTLQANRISETLIVTHAIQVSTFVNPFTMLISLQQYSRSNNSTQANTLKQLLQNKIDDLERQVLSRVNSLEEGKGSLRNETEQRGKVESTLTSLHQRITELEKGNWGAKSRSAHTHLTEGQLFSAKIAPCCILCINKYTSRMQYFINR